MTSGPCRAGPALPKATAWWPWVTMARCHHGAVPPWRGATPRRLPGQRGTGDTRVGTRCCRVVLAVLQCQAGLLQGRAPCAPLALAHPGVAKEASAVSCGVPVGTLPLGSCCRGWGGSCGTRREGDTGTLPCPPRLSQVSPVGNAAGLPRTLLHTSGTAGF